MKRANELGIKSIAATDHGSMSGHREFYFAAQAAGIKHILGIEGYISSTDRFDRRANAKRQDGTSAYNHITLLAQNQTGLTNLYKMSEIAWTEGFYGKPRCDTELLEQHSSGLIVLTGCLNGIIAKRIELGDEEGALEYALRLKDIFGENVFMEVQSHNPPEINHRLLEIADSIGMEPAMASDCHYANKEDLWIEEAMLIMATKPKLAKDATVTDKMDILEKYNYLYPERKMSFQELELYLRSYQTERDMFARQGIDRVDIFENTNLIADKVSDYEMPTGLDLLPKPKYDPNDRLRSLANGGLKSRGLFGKPEYMKRIEMELGTIQRMNQASYFLVVADMTSYCKTHGIRIGPGRGSAAGALILYALGITNVDPIKYKLLFARFLNEERNDMADIDFDIADDRRTEVKEYLARKFKNVAGISTFTYQGEVQVIKDAASVLNVPFSDVNKITTKISTFDEFETSPQYAEFRAKYPDVLKLAKALRGRLKSVGMHASGLVISNDPLYNYASIETRAVPNSKTNERLSVIANDMDTVAAIGLVKFDLLGLKTLSVIDDTIKDIKERHGVDVVLEDIDLDDPTVAKDLSLGYTMGVFQAEQPAFTRLLKEMHVDKFDHIVAANALVRPGAMNTIGPDYIARKQGRMSIPKIHPIYDEVTEDTYGACMPAEQKVLTDKGRVSIKDVCVGDSVIGRNGEHGAVNKVWLTGEKEVFAFNTSIGSQFLATADHRVLTIHGYMKASDAYKMQIPVCITRNEQTGSNVPKEWEPILLAGLLAEGSISGSRSYSFCNNDEAILDAYEHNGELLPNIVAKRYFNTRAYYSLLVQKDRFLNGYHSASAVSTYIRDLGLQGATSHTKFIPDDVFGWDVESRLKFLGFYISCDGCVGDNFVNITTVSSRLAHDIQDLLSSVGILSSIHTRNTGAFDVFIRDLAKYSGMISEFVIGEKRSALASAKSRMGESPIALHDVLPSIPQNMRQCLRDYGISTSHAWKDSTKNSLSTYEKIFGEQDHYYSTIISAESKGVMPVYDMEVESTNSFVASGVVVHNCLYQEQVMLLCNRLAGMSWSDSDRIRKIIGKKKDVHEFDAYREAFIAGASENVTKEFAEKLWHDFEAHAGYSFNQCASGKTLVRRASSGRYCDNPNISLEALYTSWNSKTPVGKKYRNLGVKVMAMDSDGRVRPKRVKNVYQNGVKETFRVTLSDGKYIDATVNHKHFTDRGYVRVDELKIGDTLFTTNFMYEKTDSRSGLGRGWAKESQRAIASDGRNRPSLGGYNAEYKRNVTLLTEGCANCGSSDAKLEVAHINSNNKDNRLENLARLCNSCHKKLDYAFGSRKKRHSKGYSLEGATIVSIESNGYEMTYDLEMDTPEHNWMGNGIVTHNSHSVAYSMLTMWTAWLKHHYPLEYMKNLLRRASKEQKTSYLLEVKRLGIKIYLPHINKSNANFEIEGDGLRYGFSNIKYLSEDVGNLLIALRPFNSAAEVKAIMYEKGNGINSRVIGALDKIGALSFPDNPLKGNESDSFWDYLGLPSINSDALPDIEFDEVKDVDEAGSFVVLALVQEIQRGNGWSRIRLVDDSGSVAVFHSEASQVEQGSMYVFLVASNRIMRYVNVNELDDVDDAFVKWLHVDKLNIKDHEKVVLAFSSRKTKAGKNMATVVFTDKDKGLSSALVFATMYPRGLGLLKPGKIVRVRYGTLDDGTKFIKEIHESR